MSMRKDTAFRRLKYRLLQHLPGQRGLRYRRRYLRLFAPQAQAQFDRAVAGATGRICIDLGANLGVHTRTLAAQASRVYAFEPDPWTAARLRENIADLPNVDVITAAAGTENGTLSLYRSAEFATDPEAASLSSSIMAAKRNVDTDNAIPVPVVDFIAFLRDLDTDIAVIKIDIEGAEVPLLEKLLDDPVLARIDHIFVETHESRIPDLAPRSEALRRRAAKLTHPKINMNWI